MRNRDGHILLTGWLLWMQAWLGALRVEVDFGSCALGELGGRPGGRLDGRCARRDGRGVRSGVMTLRARRAVRVPDGWAGEPRRRWEWAMPERRVLRALNVRLGAWRYHAMWRRVFRIFVDFARRVRGDRVLPIARIRRPECGPEPPYRGRHPDCSFREDAR